MKQFSLALKKNAQRPIVFLEQLSSMEAMLDTGALFPIWFSCEDSLKAIGGVPVKRSVAFGGFGGTATGTIYRLPVFRFGSLIFPDFPVIASSCALPCQMLLSATMFRGLIYEVDDCNYRLNVSIPEKESEIRNLKIENRNGKLHVLCTNGK